MNEDHIPDPADIRGPRNAGAQQQQPAGDLAIFGAVPAAFADAPAIAQPASGATGSSVRVGPADPSSSEPSARIIDSDDISGSGSLAAPMLAVAAAPAGTVIAAPAASGDHAPAAAPVSSGTATFVPASGSGAPALDAQTGSAAVQDTVDVAPVGAVAVDQTAAMADPTTSLETIRASLATVQEMIDNLSDRLPVETTIATSAPVIVGATDNLLAGVKDILADTQASIDATVGQAGTLFESVAQGVLAALPDVTTIVAPTIDTLIDGTAVSVGIVTTTLADVAETATGAISSSVAALTETVGDIVPVSQAVGAIDSTLDALGGADPVAGITTLVGMVSAADAFSLHDAGGPIDDFVPALGALGAADVLADIVPADALLGITDHHDGLLGGLDLDHGLLGL